MTDSISKAYAESILRPLFVGSSVSGVRFGSMQLLFDPEIGPGEVYLNLASAWHLYAARPTTFPEDEDELPEVSAEAEALISASLSRRVVSSIEILQPWPHLVLTFDNGSTLYLNGKNAQFEPWTAGLYLVPESKRIQVIACPGGELAYFLPQLA